MSKKKKRKARNSKKPPEDFLKPIDIMAFGSEADPCFGKHYDLTAPECGRCGDSELCLIKMMQSSTKKRETISEKQRFKDLEETYILAENYLSKNMKVNKKYSIEKVRANLAKKFKMESEEEANTFMLKVINYSKKLKTSSSQIWIL